jgi:hypothetical protein
MSEAISEQTLEVAIVADLVKGHYVQRPPSAFDKAFCLDPGPLIDFIQATQPKEWAKFVQPTVPGTFSTSNEPVPAKDGAHRSQAVGPAGSGADRRRLVERPVPPGRPGQAADRRPSRRASPGARDGRHPEPGPGARGLGPAVRRAPGRPVPAGSGRGGRVRRPADQLDRPAYHEVETRIGSRPEYRTALISAAVTGQIDVRGEV